MWVSRWRRFAAAVNGVLGCLIMLAVMMVVVIPNVVDTGGVFVVLIVVLISSSGSGFVDVYARDGGGTDEYISGGFAKPR